MAAQVVGFRYHRGCAIRSSPRHAVGRIRSILLVLLYTDSCYSLIDLHSPPGRDRVLLLPAGMDIAAATRRHYCRRRSSVGVTTRYDGQVGRGAKVAQSVVSVFPAFGGWISIGQTRQMVVLVAGIRARCLPPRLTRSMDYRPWRCGGSSCQSLRGDARITLVGLSSGSARSASSAMACSPFSTNLLHHVPANLARFAHQSDSSPEFCRIVLETKVLGGLPLQLVHGFRLSSSCRPSNSPQH